MTPKRLQNPSRISRNFELQPPTAGTWYETDLVIQICTELHSAGLGYHMIFELENVHALAYCLHCSLEDC